MAQYILSFSSTDATLARAGGKGANLAELVRAGFAVPPGFIVATNAYRVFVEANQIQARILACAKSVSPDDLTALENISAEIRMLFEQGALPGKVADEITSAYRQLSNPLEDTTAIRLPVAVRSSATAEDLPGLAFAGQQDTYLNVIGESAVLDAVKKCWASLWSARAIAYRARNHVPPDQVVLAAVVQTMVASESSGVLFTANPVTGRRDEMVTDASFGLGEAVVSGQVEPDHYVINPHAWTITERKLGAKETAILPRKGGGTELVERHGAQEQALPDAQIIELARIAYRVAAHFGSPQDIEWAWAGRQLYLVQSRPITSLYPLPENVQSDQSPGIYVNFNSIQGVTDPLTPLGIDAIRLLFNGVPRLLHLHSSMREILPAAGGRLFLDVTNLACDPYLRNFVLNLLSGTDPGARQTLLRLINEGRIAPKRVLTARRAVALLLAVLPILRRVLAAWVAPEQVRPRVIADAEQFIAQVQAHTRSSSDLGARLDAMENDLSHAEDTSLTVMPTTLAAFASIPILDRWLSEWLGEKPGAALQLMRGLPNNATTEMDLNLWSAAQTIRADPAAKEAMCTQSVETLVEKYQQDKLPATIRRALDEFLQAYGMRAVAEIDLGRPRWRDDPTPILQTLLGYLQIEDANLAPDVIFQRNKEQAERLAAEYIARVRKTRFGWLRAKLIGGIIRRLRALSGLREVPLFYMVRMLDVYRAVLLDSARELVARDELECVEDIFFVPLDTLKRFAQGEKVVLKDIVATERANYEREHARKQMPRILLGTGEAFYEGVSNAAASGNDLVGEAVSPGVVEGRAHVILDPRGAHLEPGEILVCPSTDPGWTPLFLTAGGLVMEIGGMITHGSVVAREYGIPAVVGVHQATTRVKSGDRVRVDGNRGRVTVLGKDAPFARA